MRFQYQILTVFFFLALSLPTLAKNVSLTDFLATADKSSITKKQKKKIKTLKNTPQPFPYIEDAQIRLRNDGLDFSGLRYSLRLSPYGFGETGAQRRFKNASITYHTDKKAMLLNQALKNRYLLGIEYLYQASVLALNKKLIKLCKKRIEVLKQKPKGMNIDALALIKAEEQHSKLLLKKVRTEKKVDKNQKKILKYLPANSVINFKSSELLDLETIRLELQKKPFSLDTENIYLRTEKSGLEKTKRRYKLEAAKGRRYISYLEFGYDHEEYLDQALDRDRGKKYDLDQSLIIKLGIRLPYINTDRKTIYKRKTEYRSDLNDYKKMKKKLEKKIEKINSKIRTLFTQLDIVAERIHRVNSDESLKAYFKQDNADPLVLSALEESTYKGRMDIERYKFDIYIEYIKLMDISGNLSRPPLKNLLSKNQTLVQQK